MKTMKKDMLQAAIYPARSEMGLEAASAIGDSIRRALERKPFCNIIFAAAPSQNEVLAALTALAGSGEADFSRVNAFHMDEYIGLSPNAPQSFANFLKSALWNRAAFHSVNCLDGNAVPEEECLRYSRLLEENPADITVMGIGENGHIAFNDPHNADFQDPHKVKVVTLDEVCRLQQVHDGCFRSLAEVPLQALTLTIPALTAAKEIFCIVPAKSKASAVSRTLNNPVDESCPATILRHHRCARLYLDQDSASLL